MSRRGLGLISIGLLLTSSLLGCAAVEPASKSEPRSGAMVVVIDDPRSERRQRGGAGPGYSARLAYQDDPALRRAAARIANDYGLRVLQQWPLDSLGVHCFVITAPTPGVLAELSADERVRWVQPFNEFDLQSAPDATTSGPVNRVADFRAGIQERGKGVKIAVIDTSIDPTHPDFKSSTLSQQNFAGARGRPAREHHGTAVVGLIAAISATAKGVTGIAQDANVNVLRACWQASAGNGKCNTLTLALALDAAVALQPDVVNLSLTGVADPVLQALVDLLLAQGSLVVAAYDDKRSASERFPQPREGVIYAYGTSDDSTPVTGANVLWAPRQALSLAPSAGYDLVSGHSIAAPQITAMAACLIERLPSAQRLEIMLQLDEWLMGG